jgi:subtilisin family serine protease
MKILTALLSVLFASTSFSQTLQNDNGWRPAWGLDRIDQREAELNDTYNYTLTGAGVSVYVFDSGINSSHEEFTGRIEPGFNVINDAYGTEDCSGHGSHTASLIGGTTYGVAKQVKLIPVRVLNCRSGNSSSATLYTAINWVIEHHQTGVPAIINLSVGMSKSMAFNEAAQALIADGLIVVGAAGNQNRDACLYSPASEPSVISVGGIDRAALRASYSNYGSCVDIFAPGSDLVGAWFGSTNIYRSSSGTSNAAPIVSGIAALMLQDNPSLTQSQVEERLKTNATRDVLFNIGSGSQNLLAYSLFDSSSPAPTTTVPITTTTIPVTTTTTPAVVVTTTTVAPQPTTRMPTLKSTRPTIPLPSDMTCTNAGARIYFYNVPYVCSSGRWLLGAYSPGRP